MKNEDITINADLEEALSYVRSEVLSALNVFLSHVKYTITLMSSIVAIALALASFGIEQINYADLCVTVSSVLLFLVFLISVISKKIVRRYYKIYVSNYFYSARLHEYAENKTKHPWNLDLIKSGFVENIHDDNAVEKFIENNSVKEKHSWFYYKLFIACFGYVCIVASILFPVYWFVK